MEPAGVLYLPARDVVKKADRAIAPDKLATLLRGELRRTGMVLSDPEVLTAMEHSALESPCYLPISVIKDGSVSGLAASVLAEAAQMGKMGRYVDELLRKVARELGDGNIDADPCRRGPQESACDWCPFASACWFDEKRDKPHTLQKTTPEEFWQLVDEEVRIARSYARGQTGARRRWRPPARLWAVWGACACGLVWLLAALL